MGIKFNNAPPRNFSEYRAYIAGVVGALVKEFGQNEVHIGGLGCSRVQQS